MRNEADHSPPPSTTRRWVNKFYCAGRGIVIGIRGEASFAVHFTIGTAVVVLAAAMRLVAWQWCVLVLCIALVLAMELLNTVVERLMRLLHPARDPQVSQLLDIAAGAVLVVAIAAALCGCIVFVPELLRFL